MSGVSLKDYGRAPGFHEDARGTESFLVDQDNVPQGGWEEEVLGDISARLSGDSLFPCVFSKNAYKKQLIKFLFVASMNETEVDRLVNGLREYVKLSRNWDGTLKTAYPLVIRVLSGADQSFFPGDRQALRERIDDPDIEPDVLELGRCVRQRCGPDRRHARSHPASRHRRAALGRELPSQGQAPRRRNRPARQKQTA